MWCYSYSNNMLQYVIWDTNGLVSDHRRKMLGDGVAVQTSGQSCQLQWLVLFSCIVLYDIREGDSMRFNKYCSIFTEVQCDCIESVMLRSKNHSFRMLGGMLLPNIAINYVLQVRAVTNMYNYIVVVCTWVGAGVISQLM